MSCRPCPLEEHLGVPAEIVLLWYRLHHASGHVVVEARHPNVGPANDAHSPPYPA